MTQAWGLGDIQAKLARRCCFVLKTRENKLKKVFFACPVRHILALLAFFILLLYYILRNVDGFADFWVSNIAMPVIRALGGIFSFTDFSVSAAVIVCFFAAILIYIVFIIYRIIRKSEKLISLYRFFVTSVMLFSLVWAGYSALWGICYYAPGFREQSGIGVRPVTADDLEAVTIYFALLANEYGEKIVRNGDGLFSEDMNAVFEKSAELFDDVAELFTFLNGPSLKAKPFALSKVLSYMGFTGFIFPFTGEANLNVHSPDSMTPVTIAHEIAHQRGVAAEDEANFVAILACLQNGDDVYCYSACLMAYIHLGNALYNTNYDAWLNVYSSLSDDVKADLRFKNAYWAQFESPVSTVSETIYTGFLQSNGQTLGMRSYGACVDLLVAYYLPDAILSDK